MRTLLGLACAGVAIAACSVGETRHETITLPVREAKETRTCDSKFVVADLSKAEPCGADGKSHCWPWAKTSIPKDELEACGDEMACIPDEILLAGGKKPKSCTFGASEAGACVPLAIKQVRENAAALGKDVCEDDERCVPCIHPIDETPTGVCEEAGVHEEDCVGGTGEAGRVETCCYGLGVCLDEGAVPGDSREDMSRETCSRGRLCAPAAMADGEPKRCEVFGGFDGVCLPLCFAAMLRGAKPVLGGGCGAAEICLPCAVGKGQGMPGCE